MQFVIKNITKFLLDFLLCDLKHLELPQRILRIPAKEISNRGEEDNGDRPGRGMLLGKLKGWGWGFPWKEDNGSRLQEREHLVLGR